MQKSEQRQSGPDPPRAKKFGKGQQTGKEPPGELRMLRTPTPSLPRETQGPPRNKAMDSSLLGTPPPLAASQNSLSARFKNLGVSPAKKGPVLLKSPPFQKPPPRPNGSEGSKWRPMPDTKDRQDDLPNPVDYSKMPDLELVTPKRLPSEGGAVVLPAGAPMAPLGKATVHYAVPLEMRSLFLLLMLKDCFRDAGWLLSVSKVSGKAAVLVTESFPQTPFFWGIRLTKEVHPRMEKLFKALGEAESGLPFLSKAEARRGRRCLAECAIGEEGTAWNRAWILERVEDVAVVFFVDFGHSGTRPVTALRRLEGEEWWSAGPLAQPFVLQGGVFPPRVMMREIVEGTAAGPLEREPHILQFVLQGESRGDFRKDCGKEAPKNHGHARPPA